VSYFSDSLTLISLSVTSLRPKQLLAIAILRSLPYWSSRSLEDSASPGFRWHCRDQPPSTPDRFSSTPSSSRGCRSPIAPYLDMDLELELDTWIQELDHGTGLRLGLWTLDLGYSTWTLLLTSDRPTLPHKT
jgi:hypothetical protein